MPENALSPIRSRRNWMSNLPDRAFAPTHENETSATWAPTVPIRPPGTVPAEVRPTELTPDGKIPAGQVFRKVHHVKCRLIKDSEKEVLIMDDGCIVYRVRKDCYKVSETWWQRTPPVKLSTTEDDKNQEQFLHSRSWVNVRWCHDGSVTGLAGEQFIVKPPEKAPDPTIPAPPPTAPLPTVPLPPDEAIRGTGASHKVAEPDGEFLITEQTYDRLIPPAQQKGCWITGNYKRFWKVTKKKLPDGPETITEKDYTPETVTPYRFPIPGCEETKALKSALPSLDDEMAMLSGQETWIAGRPVWVLGPYVRARFEVSQDAGRRGLDLRTELTRFLEESLLHVIPSIANVLASGVAEPAGDTGKARKGPERPPLE